MFFFDGQIYWAGWQAIWGDWTTHIAYITNFAYRPFPLPYNPQLLGEPFRYHFAADLLSGLLMKIGLSLTQSTVIPSIICMELLIIFVYRFFLHLFKKRSVAMISSLLFFFNGGFGMFIFIYNVLVIHNPLPPSPPLYMLTKDDSNGIRWMNFFLAEFIPQRAFLLGAPITIYVLTKAWEIYTSGIQKISKNMLVFIGIISGLLPVIHYQSFFVVFAVMIYICIISIVETRKYYVKWLWLFSPLIGISFYIMFISFGGIPTGNIRFQTGSIGPSELLPSIWFWIINTGVMSFLIPIAFIKSSKKIQVFYIPFLCIFIISNIVVFQHDPWDNRKFLVYWYLASAGLVGNLLLKIADNKQLLLSFLLFFLAIISGFIDSINLLNTDKQKYRMFSVQDTLFTQTVRSKTGVNDVFLTAPTNTYFGLTGGRQIVMGWEVWLQNYGYSTKEKSRDIKAIYAGQESSRLLIDKYSIDYIVVGPSERGYYEINDSYFQNIGKVFLQNDMTIIYDVRDAL
jgi:hypothetical protein